MAVMDILGGAWGASVVSINLDQMYYPAFLVREPHKANGGEHDPFWRMDRATK